MKFAAAALIATVSAECMDGIKMETFTDAKCKTFAKGSDDKDLSHKLTTVELEELNKECIPVKPSDAAYWKSQSFDAKTLKVTCDTSVIKATVYKEEKCKGETKEMDLVWGECKEFKVGAKSVYIKVTGAMALQAAAAAALAFVGSQF